MTYFSDEQLSAFLDSELPESEMEAIRNQLAIDDDLTNRIAQLASVDAIVSSTYHAIDEKPLPDSINQLLNSADTQTDKHKVVPISLWQRTKAAWQEHAPLATAAALLVGLTVGLTTQFSDSDESNQWSDIVSVLNQEISGQPITLVEGYQLVPRVSFVNTQNQWCRQFVLHTPKDTQHSIACHDSDGWQLEATLFDEPVRAGSYHTASSQAPINSLVDSMASGDFLTPEQEQDVIRSGWAQPSNH